MSYVPLSSLDMVLAALLVIANGAISYFYRLKLEKSLAIAVLRMMVQRMILSDTVSSNRRPPRGLYFCINPSLSLLIAPSEGMFRQGLEEALMSFGVSRVLHIACSAIILLVTAGLCLLPKSLQRQ